MRLKFQFLAVVLTSLTAMVMAQEPYLAVVNSLPLTVVADGFDGQLELLEDARLTIELNKTLWGSGGPEMALDRNDPRYKNLTDIPLLKAVLRLRDPHRKIVAEKTLERELARIRVEVLHPDRRSILVTTDLSAGFGSYSGPTTELLKVIGSQMQPVIARNTESGLSGPIDLASTLKTAWTIVPAVGGHETQKDILEVACRPDFDSMDGKFFVRYSRYHWDGEEWTVMTREVRGFWEDEGSFPEQEKFPAATKLKR